MTRLLRIVGLVGILITVGACRATVTTTVTLDSATAASTTLEVRLTGEAAAAFTKDTELLARLEKLITDRAGARPERTVADGEVRFSVPVDADHLANAATLTGVAALTVTPDGDDATLRISAVPPTALADALRGTPDPDAVPLLLKGTAVEVVVHTGAVRSVSGFASDPAAGVDLNVAGDTVTLTRTAASSAAGELVVVAEPAGSTTIWPFALVAVVALGAGAVVAGRRRR